MTRSERKTLRAAAVLLAVFLLGASFDRPEDHGPSKPGSNAPAYVNWRTGVVVTP